MLSAQLLSKQDMRTDDEHSAAMYQTFLLNAAHNKSGKAIYMPIMQARDTKSSMNALVFGNCPPHSEGMGANDAKLFVMSKAAGIAFYHASGAVVNLALANFSMESYINKQQTKEPPPEAVEFQFTTGSWLFNHLIKEGLNTGDQLLILPAGKWVAEGGAFRSGLEALVRHLRDAGVAVTVAKSLEYPSRLDFGRSFGTALKLAMAAGLGVAVDQDALVSGPEMEHFARMHMGAVCSAGGTATMSGPHAARIQSAGGTATMSGPHAARIQSAGGTATMSGPHAARIQSAGGTAGGPATMSGPHAARIQSAGGKANLGKIYKKPHQTAEQWAKAEKKRKYRAATRAALPVPP